MGDESVGIFFSMVRKVLVFIGLEEAIPHLSDSAGAGVKDLKRKEIGRPLAARSRRGCVASGFWAGMGRVPVLRAGS